MKLELKRRVVGPPANPPANLRWLICGYLLAIITLLTMSVTTLHDYEPGFISGRRPPGGYYDFLAVAGFLVFGLSSLYCSRMSDRIGVRAGMTVAASFWSVACLAQAFPQTPITFAAAVCTLAASAGGLVPGAFKALAEWFPRCDKALGFGIVFCGALGGIYIAPKLSDLLVEGFGWPSVFIFFTAVGLLWILAWQAISTIPTKNRLVLVEELSYIQQDREAIVPGVPLLALVFYRPAIASILAGAFIFPCLRFGFTNLPVYIEQKYGGQIPDLEVFNAIILFLGALGAIGGGLASSELFRHGRSLARSRFDVMLIGAGLCLCLPLVPLVGPPLTAAILAGLAAMGFAALVVCVACMTSDMLPKSSSASTAGLGLLFGCVGAMFMGKFVDWLQEVIRWEFASFLAVPILVAISIISIYLSVPKFKIIEQNEFSSIHH